MNDAITTAEATADTAPASDSAPERVYDGDSASLREAAAELTAHRSESSPRIVHYEDNAPAPKWAANPVNADGEPIDPSEKNQAYEALQRHRAERRAAIVGELEANQEQERQAELAAEQAEQVRQEQEAATQREQQQRAAVESAAKVAHVSQSQQEALRAIQQLEAAAELEFPELKGLSGEAQWQAVAALPAERQQRLGQYLQGYQVTQELAQFRGLQAHAAQRQAFEAYGNAEDEKFWAAHPELADPVKRQQMQTAALEYLVGQGLSKHQTRDLWDTNREFRSSLAQELL